MFHFGLIVLPDMVPDQRGIGQPESHSPSLAVLRSRAEAETRWEWGFSLGDSLLRFPLTWDSLTSGPGDSSAQGSRGPPGQDYCSPTPWLPRPRFWNELSCHPIPRLQGWGWLREHTELAGITSHCQGRCRTLESPVLSLPVPGHLVQPHPWTSAMDWNVPPP